MKPLRTRTPFKILEERNETLSQEVKALRERVEKLEATVRRQQNALDMLSKEIDSLYRLYERGENDGK